MPFRLVRLPRLWLSTLKFKIVAIAVVTAVSAAAVTTYFVLRQTLADTQRMLLEQVADERERTAALLLSKIELLQSSVSALAQHATPAVLHDRERAESFLLSHPAINALFDNAFVALPDGVMLARVQKGKPSEQRPNIADREYFQRVVKTGMPVVSRPVIGRASHTPVIIFAAPMKSADGRLIAVLAGALQLRSNGLMSSLAREDSLDLSREIVVDSSGLIIAHQNPRRLMAVAESEPGLGEAFAEWAAAGRTIHTEGASRLSEGYLVSMAGIPGADWMLVRMTPESVAMQPLLAAQHTAWRAAAGVGLTAALLAGVLAWWMTRPISRLRRCAEALLHGQQRQPAATPAWPSGSGEVGELSRAFQHVVEQRQQHQEETEALLLQLQAVLDNADVAVCLTRNGRFELVSQHFGRIFNCSPGQANDQPTRIIYASDEAYAALVDRARPALTEHGVFEGELELVRRCGEPFWARMRARAVKPGDVSQGTIWIIEDVTQAREQRERLAWTASHDSLTGLPNRAEFERVLHAATLQAAQQPFCALFIDLDRFKQVNDSAGHAAGDALLSDIAQQLTAQVRLTDTVARLGGDEFAVLLQHCPPAQAMAIAEKLRGAVESYRLCWEGREFQVGASIGLVPVDARFTDHTQVLRAADAACYGAKRAGRNCVVIDSAAACEAS